jgi:GntR family histidine utilization transcriptional repressor
MSAVKSPPLYLRIKQHIEQRIAAGEWQNGARLPTEFALMEDFAASRMTVHRALRELTAQGLLHRIAGVGTFVQQHPARSALLEITDIADDIARRGHAHRATLLNLESIPADAALAADFGLRRGEKLFHSEIIHHENEMPVQLEERFIAPDFAPHYLQQDFTRQTTAYYLQTIAPPVEVEHVIYALVPDRRVQTLLQIAATEPCLQLTRRTWTPSGPATKSLLIHPGSRYSLGSRYAVADWRARQPKKPLF